MRYLFGWFLICAMMAFALFINMVQMASVVIYPFSRHAFMRFNMGCKHVWCTSSNISVKLCGNRVDFVGDAPLAENAIVMANHQTMVDINMLWIFAGLSGTIGWMKWFLKDQLKYLPGIGWGVVFLNGLFVKRDWAKDKDSIKATFQKYIYGRVPVWIMIFPEGTRLKPEKIEQSKRAARKRGLPEMNRVMLPRPKGIHATLVGLDGYLSAFYDITIDYHGPAPKIVSFFTRGGYHVTLHSKRYPLSDVPQEESKLSMWLVQRFVEKEDFFNRMIH